MGNIVREQHFTTEMCMRAGEEPFVGLVWMVPIDLFFIQAGICQQQQCCLWTSRWIEEERASIQLQEKKWLLRSPKTDKDEITKEPPARSPVLFRLAALPLSVLHCYELIMIPRITHSPVSPNGRRYRNKMFLGCFFSPAGWILPLCGEVNESGLFTQNFAMPLKLGLGKVPWHKSTWQFGVTFIDINI